VRRELFIGLVVLALGLIAPLQAGLVNVPGTSDIWGAGLANAPAGSGSVLPPAISFTAGSVSSISFSSITGTVGFGGAPYLMNTADGQSAGFTGTNIDGYAGGGISGIQFTGRQFFLVGVFLGNGPATGGTAPVKLSYTDASANGLTWNPLLAQVFFIGDGLGTGSAHQTFNVPTGATRLFWGFADGAPGFGSSSAAASPNGYGDNLGFLAVNYDFNQSLGLVDAPEPASIVLMGLGIAALTLLRRRRA
jgi:hypothetical protein